MKKILLSLILLGFFSVSSIAQKTVRFYPKSEIIGMTKNTDKYAIQSIKNEPKTFFIGYDETKLSYGRGYLEFDLSNISKDVTITKVSLQLTSKINWDSNFNGKIKIKETGLKNYADQVTWGQLAGGPEIITVEINREGEGLEISNDYLKSLVQNKSKNNSKLYLALIHSNESKILRFTGDVKDLYLDVTYSTESTEPNPEPEPGVDKYISGPKTVYVGEEVEYNADFAYICQGPVKYFVSWDYSNELLELIECKDGNCVQCYTSKFKIKEINQESITTLIKTGGKERFDNKDYSLGNGYYWVTIKYRPQKLSIKENVNIVCSNSNVTYQLNGLATFAKNATITWQAGSNLTLVSGQGTSTATFKGSGNGKGVVKATVTYDGIDYPIENSDVWVGVPIVTSGMGIRPDEPGSNIPVLTPSYLCINQPYSDKNIIYVQTDGANFNDVYKWVKLTNNFNLISTGFDRATVIPNQKGTMKIEYSISNKCGTTKYPAKFNIEATNCNSSGKPINTGGGGSGGGGLDPIESPDGIGGLKSMRTAQPTSIRIYSYPTGSLVYQKKNTISFDIQNTNLGEGIYILEMTDQQGNVTREKVMKGKQ